MLMLVPALLAPLHLKAQPGAPAPVSQSGSLEQYLPEALAGMEYDPAIATPQAFFGREVADHMFDWGDFLTYMQYLAEASDRVSIKPFGRTNEGRLYIQLAVTSPKNQGRLEEIRLEHLALTSLEDTRPDLDKMPVVVNLMGSIHGNEPSGANAIALIAYIFAASQDSRITDLLDDLVLVLTPGLNPDGINRFATWVNTNASQNHVCDDLSREVREVWPSSRSNHYWADCNRDWLFMQHPEGVNSVAMYRWWMPNVAIDMHEQGNGPKGFYFSPGDPRRTYFYTPERNQELTLAIARRTAASFDAQGIPYYFGEGYDDYYIGKGAAYGDILGSVCILHEQIAPRGYIRPNASWGPVTFAQTVRNQTIAATSVVLSACAMRKELLTYQHGFYRDLEKAIAKDPVKAYKFSDGGDKGLGFHFLENLLRHEIEVYSDKNDPDGYIVPMKQKGYYTIKALFEDITHFSDSTFYDISTWTLPRAFGLEYKTASSTAGIGSRITDISFPAGKVEGGLSKVAYAFGPEAYYAPWLIAHLQREGLTLRVARSSFSYADADGGKSRKFAPGTIVIPTAGQNLPDEALYAIVADAARRSGVDIYSLKTTSTEGHSLGSSHFRPLRPSRTAILAGRGVSSFEAGEIWHLLDKRYNMDHAIIDAADFGPAALSRFNVLVAAGGVPGTLDKKHFERIGEWVREGGTLILTGNAAPMAQMCGLAEIKSKPAGGSNGVILKARLGRGTPLTWGYGNREIPIFKNGSACYSLSEGMSAAVRYADDPYISGCIADKHIEALKGTPVVMTCKCGSGNLVFFGTNVNFRSVWYGTSHLMTNAILFSSLL